MHTHERIFVQYIFACSTPKRMREEKEICNAHYFFIQACFYFGMGLHSQYKVLFFPSTIGGNGVTDDLNCILFLLVSVFLEQLAVIALTCTQTHTNVKKSMWLHRNYIFLFVCKCKINFPCCMLFSISDIGRCVCVCVCSCDIHVL